VEEAAAEAVAQVVAEWTRIGSLTVLKRVLFLFVVFEWLANFASKQF
jgi:hypothetical protein